MTLVVGIDPGLRKTGIVALEGLRVAYRGTISTPSEWSDTEARARICKDLGTALRELQAFGFLGGVWLETYEYQGPRTHTANAIRCSLLVGQVVGVLAELADVQLVERTTWGRALGGDRGRDARLTQLMGLKLKNEHERDAAAVALYGQRRGAVMKRETA